MEEEQRVRPVGESRQSLPAMRRIAVTCAVVCAVVAITMLVADGRNAEEPFAATQAMTKDDVGKMFEGQDQFGDYPSWTKTVDQINEQGKVSHGLWSYYKGPPFLNRVTMYAGNDVDITRSGNIVRRVVGLPKNFGKWEGNTYLQTFDSQQMRFVESNKHSVIVIPPLSEGNRPVLSDNAKGMLKHYISSGHNTLIVCGGPANINFINKNLLPADGGQLLEPAWTRGPYEKQTSTIGTPFQTLPVTLPNDMNHAHGIRKQSLPLEGVCYFGTMDICTVFSIKYGAGQLLFLGFDYTTLSQPWIKTLIAGMEFAS